jgi:hypothetical protein
MNADGEAKRHAQLLCQRVRTNSRISRRIIILAHLYARCDQATLSRLRTNLFPWTWIPSVLPHQLTAPSALLLTSAVFAAPVAFTATKGAFAPRSQSSSVRPAASSAPSLLDRASGVLASVTEQPLLVAAGAASALAVGGCGFLRYRHTRSLKRAELLRSAVRVVKRRPVEQLASMLDITVSTRDTVDTIRCVAECVSPPGACACIQRAAPMAMGRSHGRGVACSYSSTEAQPCEATMPRYPLQRAVM